MKIVRLDSSSKKYLEQLKKIRNLDVINDKVDDFINNSNNIAYFAIENEKALGFVWGYVLERLDSEPMMYIHSVDVLEEFRNQGIGKKIVSKLLEIANERNLRNTFLITDKNNIAANKLYTSLKGEYEPEKILYVFKK